MVISEFVHKLKGVDGSIVNHSEDAHADVIFGNDLLGGEFEDIGLHVYQNDIVTHGVYQVETGIHHFSELPEGLLDSQPGSRYLEDGRCAAATNAGQPHFQASA